MRFVRLRLQNWKNFRSVDVPLQPRTFLVGPNASGKSNLLDAFRFLRDISQAKGGGLLAAVEDARPGFAQLRSLHARQQSSIVIDVEVANGEEEWRYRLELDGDKKGPKVKREEVWHRSKQVLSRPDGDDHTDEARLRQTHLEQVNANRPFRALVEFFAGTGYLHLVPQLLRDPKRFEVVNRDPLGSDFLRRVVDTTPKTRDARLRRITKALSVAVPNLVKLETELDKSGVPHLKGRFAHWRPNAGWQDERQMSDGTIRLLALLWILDEGEQPLLLEEPELSLNPAVVREIPRLVHNVQKRRSRQVILSTHSPDLLSDEGIDLAEILLVRPGKDGSEVMVADDIENAQDLLESGASPADVVMPLTQPRELHQGLLPYTP
jgi:predicted ATPase